MKFLLTIALVLFIIHFGFTQDQIVTTSGDTTQCEITRVTDDFIHYSIEQQNETVRSRIPKSEVASYYWSREDPDKNNPSDDPQVETGDPQVQTTDTGGPKRSFGVVKTNMRLAFDVGLGYRISEAADGLPSSFVRDLRTMFHFGAGFHYFLPNNQGIGAKFNIVQNNVEGTFPVIGSTMHDITIQYVGLSFLNRRLLSGKGTNFYYGFSVGLLTYDNNLIENGSIFIIEGKTFGVGLEIGYDLAVQGSMLIGANLSATIGTLEDYNINGISSNAIRAPSEPLNRIDLTIGIRFTR